MFLNHGAFCKLDFLCIKKPIVASLAFPLASGTHVKQNTQVYHMYLSLCDVISFVEWQNNIRKVVVELLIVSSKICHFLTFAKITHIVSHSF